MGNDLITIRFHSPMSGQVDRANAVIRNVSLITGFLTAEGHDLEVDATTLTQILLSAQKMGQVPVKLNHGSGIENVCGYLENFRLEGNKVKGDWHLLKSHSETDKMLERAERMHSAFGLSVAFKGKGVLIAGGKKAARCEELKAVDCVTSPAANPDGLFSSREVDTQKTNSMSTQNKNIEFTAEQVAELIAENARLADENEQLTSHIESSEIQDEVNEPLTDEQLAHLAQLSDAELTEAGISRAQVLGELDSRGYDVSGANDSQVDNGNDGGDNGNDGGNAGDANGAALAAVQRGIQELQARERAKEIAFANAEQEHAFAVLTEKIDAAIELNTLLAQENESLKATVKRFQSKLPSLDTDSKMLTLFGKKENDGSFEGIVSEKFVELKAAGVKELSARAQATEFAIRNNPTEYKEWRSRGGEIRFGNK